MNNDNVFKALSDNNRRQILKLLRKSGGMTAGEIAKQFSIAQPTVSEHLKILKHSGLLSSERKGQYIEYALNASILEELIEVFFDLLPKKTDTNPDSLERSPIKENK